MRLRALIYDLDGTVVDSGKPEKSLLRLNASLQEHGYSLDDAAIVRAHGKWGMRGGPFLSHVLNVDLEEGQRLYTSWQNWDLRHPQPFVENAIKTLELLRDAKVYQAMVSNRESKSLFFLTDREQVFKSFCEITCEDHTKFHKPDKRAFRRTLRFLRRTGIRKDECVYVGDTMQDLLAGRAADIRTVMVQTGPYDAKKAGDDAVPDWDLLPSVADLPQWINNHYAWPHFK